jgi:hypothetical protein
MNRGVQDTTRGPSPSLWGDFPIDTIFQGAGGSGGNTPGFFFFDEFEVCGLPALNAASQFGKWACWADTGSTFTDSMQEGGVLKLVAAAAGNQVCLGSTTGSFRLVSGATGYPYQGKLWFEARIALGALTTGISDFFIGLADNTASQMCSASGLIVAAAGNTLVTAKNLLGFHKRATTNFNDVGVAYNVAGGVVQYPTNLQTLITTVTGNPMAPYTAVANAPSTGFVKLGMLFDPTPANPSVIAAASVNGQVSGQLYKPVLQFFVNGQLVQTFLASINLQAATFPIGYLAPCIVFGAQSATPAGYVDWIRVGQLGTVSPNF